MKKLLTLGQQRQCNCCYRKRADPKVSLVGENQTLAIVTPESIVVVDSQASGQVFQAPNTLPAVHPTCAPHLNQAFMAVW